MAVPSAGSQATVDSISPWIGAIGFDWPMLEALAAGTTAMRAAGQDYLPMFPAEETDDYVKRLNKATLLPAYSRTVNVMSGKPFSSQLKLSEDMPTQMQEWAQDIDREGVSMHVFAEEMFQESFFGLAGILVEAPVQAPGQTMSRFEQRRQGLRPYWVRVKHRQILGGRIRKVNGVNTLVMLRLKADSTEDDGPFGEKVVQRVRVLTPGKWEVYTKNPDNGDWTILEGDSGVTGLPYIPFVPLYGRRLGFMQGLPVLAELGHLNVKHWQSQSDQDNILHYARIPILFGKGAKFDIVMGGGKVVNSDSKDADLKWVEHNGAAIDAGQGSLDALEQQMIQTGAEMIVNQSTGSKTATEDANDAEGNKCDLRRMSETYEDCLDQALAITADLGGLEQGGTVEVFKDFGVSSLGQASATLVKDLMVANKLTTKTGLIELQRRGELSTKVNVDDEVEEIADQGPELGDIPPADPALPVA